MYPSLGTPGLSGPPVVHREFQD